MDSYKITKAYKITVVDRAANKKTLTVNNAITPGGDGPSKASIKSAFDLLIQCDTMISPAGYYNQFGGAKYVETQTIDFDYS